MKIQFLHFPDCPHAGAARQVLRRALSASGLPPSFEEVNVNDRATPENLRAWGSPTILIDGLDAAGERQPAGAACCRLYAPAAPGTRGVPPEALIRKAISRARSRRRMGISSLAASLWNVWLRRRRPQAMVRFRHPSSPSARRETDGEG